MTRTCMLTGLLLLWTSFVFGRGDTPWNSGQLVKKDGEILYGSVRYNYKNNVVQYRYNDNLLAFSPHQLDHFRFYDADFKTERLFIVHELPNRNGYASPVFMEVLVWGELPVLGVLKSQDLKVLKDFREQGASSPFASSPYAKVVNYDYYVLAEEHLVQMNDFKQKILPLMQAHKEKLRNYISENRLRYYKHLDCLLIIGFHNRLQEALNRNKSQPEAAAQ